MANSVDPGQTAPIGAVCSGSTLFVSIFNLSVMLGNICSRQLQQTTFSDYFFLGALRVKKQAKVSNFCISQIITFTPMDKINIFLQRPIPIVIPQQRYEPV